MSQFLAHGVLLMLQDEIMPIRVGGWLFATCAGQDLLASSARLAGIAACTGYSRGDRIHRQVRENMSSRPEMP